MTIVPRDLNIVLQRPEPLAPNERFDLIVATNILIYYDVFEQSLALSNVARMLRPGASFSRTTNPPSSCRRPRWMSSASRTSFTPISRTIRTDSSGAGDGDSCDRRHLIRNRRASAAGA